MQAAKMDQRPANDTRGHRLEMLSEKQLRQVHWASLELLEQAGVQVPYQPLLELLRHHEAYVDLGGRMVRFPTSLVEGALNRAPSRFIWHPRDPHYGIHLGRDRVYFLGASTLVTAYGLEGCRRPGTFQDCRDFSRLKDALPNIDDGYGVVHPQDVPECATPMC